MTRILAPALLLCVLSAPLLAAQTRPSAAAVFSRAALGGMESERWLAGPAGELPHLRSAPPRASSFGTSGVRWAPIPHAEAAERDDYERWAGRLAVLQGAYYTATGLWPIFHMRSFEQVTGPKTDDWLVKTVGGLIAVVGGTLLVSGVRDAPSRDLAAVAVGSAAALTAVDVIYVAQGRISPIYLLDAAVETVLIVGWAVTLQR